MRKLRKGLPDPRRLLDPDIGAPTLTEILRSTKIGTSFKTTRYDRYPETTRLLAGLRFAHPPVVLDVGASDGSAALAVMEKLPFSRYYVTDRHLRARLCPTRTGMFFCDMESKPWFYANRCFVVYNDFADASWLFRGIAARVFNRFDPADCADSREIDLINPNLAAKRGDSIHIERYSIFDEWDGEKADLVIAANLLNRAYFPDAELRAGLLNLRAAMRDGGVLAIIENRNRDGRTIEQSSIFRYSGGRFLEEVHVGSGSDIRNFVTALQ